MQDIKLNLRHSENSMVVTRVGHWVVKIQFQISPSNRKEMWGIVRDVWGGLCSCLASFQTLALVLNKLSSTDLIFKILNTQQQSTQGMPGLTEFQYLRFPPFADWADGGIYLLRLVRAAIRHASICRGKSLQLLLYLL